MSITKCKSSVLYQIIKDHVCQLHFHICFLPCDTLDIHFLSLHQATTHQWHYQADKCVTVTKSIDHAVAKDTVHYFAILQQANCCKPCCKRHCEAKSTYTQKSCAHQILYVLHVALAVLTQLTHINHLLLNGSRYLYWGGGQAPQWPLLLQERRGLLLPCLRSSANCSKEFCNRLCCCHAEATFFSS